MGDIRSIRATATPPEPAAAPNATYAEQFTAAVDDGALCPCGDMIGGHRATLAAPTRESGAPRGVCRCFRARARQVPAGARR